MMTLVIGKNKAVIRNTQYAVRSTKLGFTLIELALVAVIIVILVSISTPLFRRTFYDMQLEETSYNIVKFMNYARAKAISEGVNTKLNFDFDIRKYWLTAPDPEEPKHFIPIKGKLGRFYEVPSGVEMEGEVSTLIFYPNGRSKDFKLYLKNKIGKTKLIKVKKETGQADAVEY